MDPSKLWMSDLTESGGEEFAGDNLQLEAGILGEIGGPGSAGDRVHELVQGLARFVLPRDLDRIELLLRQPVLSRQFQQRFLRIAEGHLDGPLHGVQGHGDAGHDRGEGDLQVSRESFPALEVDPPEPGMLDLADHAIRANQPVHEVSHLDAVEPDPGVDHVDAAEHFVPHFHEPAVLLQDDLEHGPGARDLGDDLGVGPRRQVFPDALEGHESLIGARTIYPIFRAL